jgi:hypothetical protein
MIRGLKCKRDQFRNYGSRQSLRLLRNLDRADTVRARQLLGIADLVNSLALGTLSGVIDPHGISTAAMGVLPMSYIPTFAVPVFLILHFICIAQARR